VMIVFKEGSQPFDPQVMRSKFNRMLQIIHWTISSTLDWLPLSSSHFLNTTLDSDPFLFLSFFLWFSIQTCLLWFKKRHQRVQRLTTECTLQISLECLPTLLSYPTLLSLKKTTSSVIFSSPNVRFNDNFTFCFSILISLSLSLSLSVRWCDCSFYC
jgi:hypothetical protein